MSNPFVYTDRDFVSFRNQMIDFLKDRVPGWSPDPSDFAYSMVEGMAYIGDMMSYYVDRAAQESNILTANSPKNVYALARLFGYSPGLAISAWCNVEFVNTGTEEVTIAEGTKVGANSGGLSYELMQDVVLAPKDDPDGGDKKIAEVWEGETRYVELGVSSGVGNQRFLLTDQGVDGRLGALSVLTTDPTDPNRREFWTHTELLLDSPAGDYVFSAVVDPDGTTYISFGDGVSGRVPPKGWTIGVRYRVTEGAAGNAPGSTLTRFLVSWDDPSLAQYANVTVQSVNSPSGGRDLESLESIRSGTVNLTKTQRRAVTAGDFEAIARADSRVLDAHCQSQVWSRPTVWVAPRDQSLYGSVTMLDQLESVLEESLTKVAMAGVEPDVRFGIVKDVGVEIEVISAPSVDVDYVVLAVQEAVFNKFSYEHGMFGEPLSADHIIRAISDAIPTSVVQFARVGAFNDLSHPTGKTEKAEALLEVTAEANELIVIPSLEAVEVTVTPNTSTGRTRF